MKYLTYLHTLKTKTHMTQKIKTQMKFNTDNSIEGIFMLPDKSITNFYVDSSGNWEQFGNTQTNQKKTINELVALVQIFYYTDL